MSEHEPIRYGAFFGHRSDGWWAYFGSPARYGSQCRSMTGGSFWAVVKFFVIPTRYYVWKYKRQQQP